jgi:hypothetical protein
VSTTVYPGGSAAPVDPQDFTPGRDRFSGIWHTCASNLVGGPGYQFFPYRPCPNTEGFLTLQAVNATKGKAAVRFYSGGKLMCVGFTVYYTGAYLDKLPSGQLADAGQIAGCADAHGWNLSAWYKSGAGPQFGTLDLHMLVGGSQTTFYGEYDELSSQGAGKGRYEGLFAHDFVGSGRTS